MTNPKTTKPKMTRVQATDLSEELTADLYVDDAFMTPQPDEKTDELSILPSPFLAPVDPVTGDRTYVEQLPPDEAHRARAYLAGFYHDRIEDLYDAYSRLPESTVRQVVYYHTKMKRIVLGFAEPTTAAGLTLTMARRLVAGLQAAISIAEELELTPITEETVPWDEAAASQLTEQVLSEVGDELLMRSGNWVEAPDDGIKN